MPCLESRNVVFRPGVEAVARLSIAAHPDRRIVLAHPYVDCERHQRLEAVKQIVRSRRPIRHAADDRLDMLALDSRRALVAVLGAEPFEDAPVGRLRAWPQA